MNNISPKIVRVWFDTVLNPMIGSLETELNFLKIKNLTWKGFNNSFDALRPLQTVVNYRYFPNYEQLVMVLPEMLEIIGNHDNKLARLNDISTITYTKLKNSSLLKNYYYDCLEAYITENNEITQHQIEDFNNENSLRFIAEYIINNRGELESSYVLSPLWNPNRNKFLAILDSNELILFSKEFRQNITDYEQIVHSTCEKLKEIRNNMSFKYGEPIVTTLEFA